VALATAPADDARKIIARWSSALVRFRHADRRPLRLASARDRLAGIAIKAANARPFHCAIGRGATFVTRPDDIVSWRPPGLQVGV